MTIDEKAVFEGVGNTRVDHVSIHTPGMLRTATVLFQHLGYTEDTNRRKEGDWGVTRFMTRPGSIEVQLTEPVDGAEIPVGENHVAFRVEDPKKVAIAIANWLFEGGISDTVVEEYPGGKFFFTAPTVLAQSLEFVPIW